MNAIRSLGGSLLVFAVVGGVCIAGVAMLSIATWLAWPDSGTSTYSTAANVAQLGLVLAGAAAAAFSVRTIVLGSSVLKTLLIAALAVGCWALWWVLFPGLGVGDSSV